MFFAWARSFVPLRFLVELGCALLLADEKGRKKETKGDNGGVGETFEWKQTAANERRAPISLSRPLPLLSLTSDTKKINKKINPCLRKDYLEIQYANVRVPVDPSIVEGNCVPFKV